MTQYGLDDLDGMNDLGPSVVFGSTSITGLYLDERDAIRQDSGSGLDVQLTVTVLGVKAGDLPSVAFGDSLTIDGTAYTVRSVDLTGDGAIEEIVVVATT